jgi:hypothetical protein
MLPFGGECMSGIWVLALLHISRPPRVYLMRGVRRNLQDYPFLGLAFGPLPSNIQG